MSEAGTRGAVRSVARGIWSLLPAGVKSRIRAELARARAKQLNREIEDIVRFEQARRTALRAGRTIEARSCPDFLDAGQLSRLSDLPAASFQREAQTASGISDSRSAATFVIGLWLTDPEVRTRFRGLFRDSKTSADFVEWLAQARETSRTATGASLTFVQELFARDHAARARQAFFVNDELRSALPHGLTPPGMAALFRWYARVGMKRNGLVLSEVVWLFLQASQAPAKELLLAYAFCPEWQKAHPDGVTVFGREAFARWFAQQMGEDFAWLDTAAWDDWANPDEQIRTSYWARSDWRQQHPRALETHAHALKLLDWLGSPDSPESDEARAWCLRQPAAPLAASLTAPGMNVLGHFTYPSGLRVSVESLVQAAQGAGVPFTLRDVRADAKDDPHHVAFRGSECHDVTLIHAQPEPFFDEAYSRAGLWPRSPRPYRIAFWYWEFDSIPESWVAHAAGVDEVWAATEFVAKGLRERLPQPVRTLFPGVKLGSYRQRPRTHFGLEQDKFTFLFTFHMVSIMERKNPLGLIRAFRQAFRPDEPVCLVLKTSFGDRYPAQIEELHRAAAGHSVRIIDAVYSPDEVLSIMDSCDAYVSLHRSEGLGLTMAEAMLMGKPVIATNYSGNVDFMDESNSLLVPYTLKKLGRPIPPYDADAEWAEPSIEHAAQAMRRLYDDRDFARSLGERARASALERLSLETAGLRIKQRLSEIRDGRARSAGQTQA